MKYLAVIALCLAAQTNAQRGPCFEFNGTAYLEFRPDHFDISNGVHYTMNIQTTQRHGILLYAHGSHDYEILYIRNGILTYDLVNPEASGVGRSFGVHLESNHKVNNDTLIAVQVFRNRRVRRGVALMPGARAPIQTGLVLKVVGSNFEEEHLTRRGHLVGVRIRPPVYIGGANRDLSDTVREFRGQISDIWEKKNGRSFVDPSRNLGARRCMVGRMPL